MLYTQYNSKAVNQQAKLFMDQDTKTPSYFIWRRLHSLAGLWLVIFVIFHLLTNSQAALPIGGDGHGFIHSVNAIHDLPYLPVIEIAILAFPILIHIVWGVMYLRTAEYNSFGNTGHAPYLPQYPRNHAYTWQRITSWLLIVGIIAHVIHMRFIEYPSFASHDQTPSYMVRVTVDDGLYTLAARLGVHLYDEKEIEQLLQRAPILKQEPEFLTPEELVSRQAIEEKLEWLATLKAYPLKTGEVIASASTFGAAELLMVRDTFKMPLMLVLYTLLVLTTCFHAFNGLWTLMISWGVTLTERSQWLMRRVCTSLMLIVGFLGLAAIWITYWINLKS